MIKGLLNNKGGFNVLNRQFNRISQLGYHKT